MKRLLRIGDMARLCGVSVKALRFYDEQGLLKPDHVDPQTGYREYSVKQADALAAIVNLRAIDFSIAEIAALFDDGDFDPQAVRRAIADKRVALKNAQDALAQKIRLSEIMADLIADADGLRFSAQIDQRVYAVRTRVAHLGAPVTEIFETAEARVAEANARAPVSPFLLFHDPPTTRSDIDIEVCVPVLDYAHTDNASIVAGQPFVVATVYAGGYAATNRLFDDMRARVADAGLQIAGPLREIYHRFGADQEDYSLPKKMIAARAAEFLTELQLPVALPA